MPLERLEKYGDSVKESQKNFMALRDLCFFSDDQDCVSQELLSFFFNISWYQLSTCKLLPSLSFESCISWSLSPLACETVAKISWVANLTSPLTCASGFQLWQFLGHSKGIYFIYLYFVTLNLQLHRDKIRSRRACVAQLSCQEATVPQNLMYLVVSTAECLTARLMAFSAGRHSFPWGLAK